MMKTKLLLCFLFANLVSVVFAQEPMTLKQAFDRALEQNFSIRVLAGETEIAKVNNSAGAAGMMPVISGTLAQDNQVANTRQKFLSGTENNRNNARTQTLNGGVELNWTIFDGMRMFAAKERLTELQRLGETRFRQQAELLLARVAKAYFDAVLLRDQLNTSQQFLSISEKRFEVARANYEAGKSIKSEMLTAQVNLNADRAAHRRLKNAADNANLTLSQLLGMGIGSNIKVVDSLSTGEVMNYDLLLEQAKKNNTGLAAAEIARQVARLQLREAKGERYPSLVLRSGYTYAQQESQAGFLQSSKNTGMHLGAGVNMNLFDGFRTGRKVEVAGIAFKNSELVFQDSLLKLQVGLLQAYQTWQTLKELSVFEESNLKIAAENFELAKLRHDQGLISMNDLRIAQQSYLQSVNRYQQSAYDLRISETDLRRISGSLMNR